jgi:hypothetical protein
MTFMNPRGIARRPPRLQGRLQRIVGYFFSAIAAFAGSLMFWKVSNSIL